MSKNSFGLSSYWVPTAAAGFLMMAVAAGDSATPKPIGRFINNPWEARSLDCSSGSQVLEKKLR